MQPTLRKRTDGGLLLPTVRAGSSNSHYDEFRRHSGMDAGIQCHGW
ncbi:MAG: hypothetical protein Q8N96_02620 [Methylovulum sp.]|nr:hypothetical protein [Methylovulum sp.]